MSNKMTPIVDKIDPSDVDLDALLDDLDLDDIELEPTESTPADDELDSLLDDIDVNEIVLEPAEETAVELYDDDAIDDDAQAAPETKRSEVEKNKEAAKKTEIAADDKGTPEPDIDATTMTPESLKRVRVSSTLPMNEIIKAKLGESGEHLLEIEEGVTIKMSTLESMPKKVKEKFVNLISHLHLGANLSVYTQIAIDTLAKDGSVTNASLQTAYMESCAKGTAASQAGQMTRLFKDLRICSVEGKTLVKNDKSKLATLLIGDK